uniref:Group-specific protein n=1 Tax=Strongyloides stercoralis TaxID=6248 RepID=A0A0K0DTP7_STRER
MNGLLIFSSFVLGIGVVLLIITIDKTIINQGMNFTDVTRTTIQIIGIVFTILGSLLFFYSVYRKCIQEHKKKYKDDDIKKIKI